MFYLRLMPSIIRRLFLEPFVQFIILGGFLFVVVSYFQHGNDKASRDIIVDNERIRLMLLNYKTQTGNLPTKKQLDAFIENYIKEEISFREAKRMGLDKDDEIIRRRLTQKFEFLQTDLVDIAPPSEADLKQFYAGNPALFSNNASVSFSHIYFSTDQMSNAATEQKALSVLRELQQTSLTRAPEKGDRFPLQYDYTEQTKLDLKQNFGNSQMTDELFKGPLHVWIGPVQSGYGWHLIYIIKRESAAELPFEAVKEEVKIKWMDSVKSDHNQKLFEKLGKKYNIIRTYRETK
jgi:peptidyl-prolyl cis-trans isomerase C